MRLPLRRGRFFNDGDNRDGGRRTFIVNETLAREMFGNSDPLGQRLIVDMGDNIPGEIVGVVGDTKHVSLDGAIRPMVYYAQAQLPISFGSFVVRTRGNPELLANAVVAAIRKVKKDQPASDVRSMDEWIGRSIAQQRFQTALLGSFALIAVLLAVLGVYGVMSYTVEQRSHEIGVRLAVGAEPGALRRWVTVQGMALACAGLALGIGGAAVTTRALKSLLYDTAPSDPATFAGAAVLLAVVCLAAVSIPAHRATRVDPLVALRWE
jgi:putative ABC transport system permease protein